MSAPTCQIAPEVELAAPDHTHAQLGSRRNFLRRVALTAGGLTCLDFLGYFAEAGLGRDSRTAELGRGAALANTNPRFLIYWFLEGGWLGYDMFNPVLTA